jgi:hypothetical protein
MKTIVGSSKRARGGEGKKKKKKKREREREREKSSNCDIPGTYDVVKEVGACTVQGNLEVTNRTEALAHLEARSLCEAAGLSDEERARDMAPRSTGRDKRGRTEGLND